MLGEALRSIPESFPRAGRRYAVVPAHVAACFHPKIVLRLGKDRARLQVVSANATAAGWCRNLEVASDVSWIEGGENPDNASHRRLIRKAYDYLCHWLDPTPGQTIASKLNIHKSDAIWLADTEPNAGPLFLADGTAVDLLLERGDATDTGILSRLLSCVGGDRIRRIVVVSPYWDADGTALLDIQDVFGVPPVVVAINPKSGAFPGGFDVSQRPISFATDDCLDSDRFAHAKLVILEGDGADHVLSGSPNASRAALGGPGGVMARNAEAAVYRRLSSGSVLPALGLALARTVERCTIHASPANSFHPGSGCVPSGVVEIEGRLLTWWPALGYTATGAMLVGPSGPVPVRAFGNGQYAADLSDAPPAPLVVHFKLADGRETLPVIVHDHEALRLNSPGSYGPISSAVLRYERGIDDLIDLAATANYLFALPAHAPGSAGGGKRENGADEHEIDYADEDAFRKAMELPRSAGHFASSGADDPVSCLLRRIGLGCVIGTGDPRAERERERQEDEEAEAGETEDDAPDAGDEGAADTTGEPAWRASGNTLSVIPVEQAKQLPGGVFTAKQVTKRRRNLVMALRLFDAWLAAVARDPALPADDVPAKVAFMLRLMNEAARLRHPMEDGSNITLMTMVPDGDDRDSCVAVRAIMVLRVVWRGLPHTPPLAQRLNHHSPRARIQQEISAFALLTRWIAARCVLALEDADGHSELLRLVEGTAVHLITATYLLGVPDAVEEEIGIMDLERAAGGNPSDSARILQRIEALATGMLTARPAALTRGTRRPRPTLRVQHVHP